MALSMSRHLRINGLRKHSGIEPLHCARARQLDLSQRPRRVVGHGALARQHLESKRCCRLLPAGQPERSRHIRVTRTMVEGESARSRRPGVSARGGSTRDTSGSDGSHWPRLPFSCLRRASGRKIRAKEGVCTLRIVQPATVLTRGERMQEVLRQE